MGWHGGVLWPVLPIRNAADDAPTAQASVIIRTMRKRNAMDHEDEMSGEAFDALPAAEKERIYRELEAESPEHRLARSKPLTAAQRARWQRIQRKLNSSKKATPVKISVGVEPQLLRRADAYAKRIGITRAQLISRGPQALLGTAA